MKTILIILISNLFLGIHFRQDDTAASINEDSSAMVSDADFECVLTVNKIVLKAGEMPEFKVEIKNLSSKEVYLIGSLEGSERKFRLPYCYFTIEKPFEDPVRRVGMCGVLPFLKVEDFKLVKPNEIFDPYSKIDEYGYYRSSEINLKENFRKPGKYKIQFHYSTKANNLNGFNIYNRRADFDQLVELLDKVPKIELSSNVIELEIVK